MDAVIASKKNDASDFQCAYIIAGLEILKAMKIKKMKILWLVFRLCTVLLLLRLCMLFLCYSLIYLILIVIKLN